MNQQPEKRTILNLEQWKNDELIELKEKLDVVIERRMPELPTINRLRQELAAAKMQLASLEKHGHITHIHTPELPTGTMMPVSSPSEIQQTYQAGVDDGIIRGITTYGEIFYDSTYELYVAEDRIYQLAVLELNARGIKQLSQANEDLLVKAHRFEEQMNKLKDNNLIVNIDWLDSIKRFIADLREVVMNYTRKPDPDRLNALREFCFKNKPQLKEMQSQLKDIPLRVRGMMKARQYIAKQLRPYFDMPGEMMLKAFIGLAEQLRALPSPDLQEQGVIHWVDKHYPNDPKERTSKTIRLLQQALSDIKIDYKNIPNDDLSRLN